MAISNLGRNSGKLFTQGILFEIFLRENRVGNPESYTLTLPVFTRFVIHKKNIKIVNRQLVKLRKSVCNGCGKSLKCLIVEEKFK